MIIANMATFPKRASELEVAIERLAPQVDLLNVVLNEHSSIPRFLAKFMNVCPIIPSRDLKDTGKFLAQAAPDDLVFLVDDDIQYPEDYVRYMEARYRHIQGVVSAPFVLGVHGIIYSDLFDGDQRARNVIVFWRGLSRSKLVNQLGTGTCVLQGELMPDITLIEGSQRFVDVRFAAICQRRSVAMICIDRPDGWLVDQPGERETLFHSFTNDWPSHVVREVQTFCGYSRLSRSTALELQMARSASAVEHLHYE